MNVNTCQVDAYHDGGTVRPTTVEHVYDIDGPTIRDVIDRLAENFAPGDVVLALKWTRPVGLLVQVATAPRPHG